MSIDLNSIKSSADLIEYVGIKNIKFNDCDVNSFLSTIWNSVDSIWRNIDLREYTNHNLDHSLKIISNFMEMEPLYSWSNYEKLLFTTAALIHDIGMQYNVWAQSFTKFTRWPKPPLSHNDIRKKHVKLGSRLVFDQINNKYKKNYPYKFVTGTDGDYAALYTAAFIAFSHSGDEYLK